jgi:hypothetical protein
MLTPVPMTVACEMVALVPPELVRLTVWPCVLPTVTLLNAKLAGIATNCPATAPLPETDKDALMGVVCAPDEPEAVPHRQRRVATDCDVAIHRS